MKTPLDVNAFSVVFPDLNDVVIISADGKIIRKDRGVAAETSQQQRYLICHRKWSEARLQAELPKAVDVMELFAFVRPAQFCLPTPAGLAARLSLATPVSAEDKALTILHAAQKLIDELAEQPDRVKQKLARLADMMGRGGWQWTGPVMSVLGAVSGPEGPPDGRNAAIWVDLDEIGEIPPRGEPGISPVMPDAARERLQDILGKTAETRQTQSDYAAALTSVFASPDSTSGPVLLLAEAGTGTGKTLGYLAPATLWAEANKAAVWVSTYTRTLQHQIADELSRLYDRSETGGKRVVIRKGRENYLCLLNLEEALSRLPGQPLDAVALGLMARWASASADGDLTGNNFPAWLIDLIGTRASLGLADRRGECIHSACPHYHKCFVEKSIRTARQADIVIANHALVMIQAAFGGIEDKFSPNRYIFDEGHHVFNAADSAFAAALTAGEAAELRRWVRGAEDGRRGRARGLEKRLAELVADDEAALAALDEASEAARILPGTGWRKRLSEASPAGPAEAFFAAVREAVYARTTSPDSMYDLQAELYPAPEAVIKAGLAFEDNLTQLSDPLMRLAKYLQGLLDDEADQLDSQARARIEGAARGLVRRAAGPVAAWLVMLADLTGSGRDGFIDWMQIDRRDSKDVDLGLLRHWLDPTVPFSQQVLDSAHGVAITSATLKDETEDNQGWAAAKLVSGAAHLDQPALLTEHTSPFDYAHQARIFIVNDVARDRAEGVAAAMAALMVAANGGALGLFTSIQRLRATWPHLIQRLGEADIPLYAQHMDRINLQTLLQLFREDRHSALIGTDAVRDGVDVPGDALRMMIYDRVPWPRPDMLFRARSAWQGRDAWTDRITRMKLRQAFGRLIRRADDKGIFVMLDSRLPTRLTAAFPKDVKIVRCGLAEAIAETKVFLN